MSIAERLREIDLSAVSSQKGAAKVEASLQTDNFAVLLVQGLESNDAATLNVSGVSPWSLIFVAQKSAFEQICVISGKA